jgi:hypothetical protein
MAGAMDQKLPKIRDEERESKVRYGKNFKQGKGNLKGQSHVSGSVMKWPSEPGSGSVIMCQYYKSVPIWHYILSKTYGTLKMSR